MKKLLILITIISTINIYGFEKERSPEKIALNQQQYIQVLEERSKSLPLEKQKLIQKRIEKLQGLSEEDFNSHKRKSLKKLKNLNKEDRKALKRKMFCHKIKEIDEKLLEKDINFESYKNYIEKDKLIQKMPEERKDKIIKKAQRYFNAPPERKNKILERMKHRYNKICSPNGIKIKEYRKNKNFERGKINRPHKSNKNFE